MKMSNELKDITYRLCDYENTKGWQVTKAEQLGKGKWDLTVEAIPEEPKEEETQGAENV